MSLRRKTVDTRQCDWCDAELKQSFFYFSINKTFPLVFGMSKSKWPVPNEGYPLVHQTISDPEFCSVEHAQAYKDQIVIHKAVLYK